MTINTGLTLEDLELFLLILIRITSFTVVAPFFNMSSTPMRVKVGFCVFVSLLIAVAMPLELPAYDNLFEYTALIVKESITGLLIGMAAFICQSTILFAGRMIDMEIGMSMANMFDQTTRTQTSLTGGLYNYLVLMMLIVTDMHHFLLQALTDSFYAVPIGAIRSGGLYDRIIGFCSDYFLIGFRIVLPIFTVTLILNLILALLAKVAPQMNMFAVGIQLKVMVGLATIFLLSALVPSMAKFIFNNMKAMVIEVIKGML